MKNIAKTPTVAFNDFRSFTPLQISTGRFCRPYLEKLLEMIELLKECPGTKHAATLCYWHGDGKLSYVDCKVIEVNKSTLKYKYFRVHTEIDGQKGYVSTNLGTGKQTDRFVKDDCYLIKVDVSFGIEHNIGSHDDG